MILLQGKGRVGKEEVKGGERGAVWIMAFFLNRDIWGVVLKVLVKKRPMGTHFHKGGF